MFVPFNKLPGESRLWIYQAARKLSDEEQQVVLQYGKAFIDQWTTHGQPLMGSCQVRDGFFIVLAVDDRQLPSGCSIDASVGLIRKLGEILRMDLFDRTQVPLWVDEKVVTKPLKELKDGMKQGAIAPDTLLIDTLVSQKEGLDHWIVPIRDSWLRRYLPQPQEN